MPHKPGIIGFFRVVTHFYFSNQSNPDYLLGDTREFNTFVLSVEKEPSGRKVVQIRGLKPLGFNEVTLRDYFSFLPEKEVKNTAFDLFPFFLILS